MVRPKTYTDELRNALIDGAAEIVAARGLDGLSLRTLAAEHGTSTNAIYAMFGGKTELIRTVVQKAALGFGRTQAAAVKNEDVVVDLLELGLAYRRWAIENRALYTVMFSSIDYDNVADEHRDGVSSELSEGSQGPLIELLDRAHDEGLLLPVPVPAIAASVWANVHGFVSLDIAPWSGLPEDRAIRDEIYRMHLEAILRGWVRPDIDLSERIPARTTTSAPAS